MQPLACTEAAVRIRSVKELPVAMQAQLPKHPWTTPKFRNQPICVDGMRFDSKLEARCYQWLKTLEAAGAVVCLVRQPSWDIGGGVKYRADFLAVGSHWPAGFAVIDAKGYDMQSGRNKRKQLQAKYGIEVELWRDAQRRLASGHFAST